ncbi:MAG: glycosyltransferase family 2 protein [Terriglobia bacterium]
MPRVTIAIPTLHAGRLLSKCLGSLARQTFTDFEVIILDNSGCGRATDERAPLPVHIVDMRSNAGFGVAVNHAIRSSSSSLVATLNDDTEAHAEWLEALVSAADKHAGAGMFASQIRLFGTGLLDSAGMLIARDGSSKQRGRFSEPSTFGSPGEVLFPSACAALYRRAMLDDIGLFDETFFLYCEDTDLGLRARWAGWSCQYVPAAVVEHHYSASAAGDSELKARCVERNRLRVLAHNFPAPFVLQAPFVSMARFYMHFREMKRSPGAATGRVQGISPWAAIRILFSAHLAFLRDLPSLIRRRHEIRRGARVGPADFAALLRAHTITVRQLAGQT